MMTALWNSYFAGMLLLSTIHTVETSPDVRRGMKLCGLYFIGNAACLQRGKYLVLALQYINVLQLSF